MTRSAMLQLSNHRRFIAITSLAGEGYLMKTWQTIHNFLIVVLLISLIILPSGSASSSSLKSPAGAIIVVNTNNDDFDPADDFDDSCSLREAIYTVMYDSNYGGCSHTGDWGSDTITLPEGEFDLLIPGIEDAGIAGDLDIYLPTRCCPSSIDSIAFSPAAWNHHSRGSNDVFDHQCK